MSFYVYSTGTCSGVYCDYIENKDISVASKRVTINGGRGVAGQAHNGSAGHIYTPAGALTIVNDEDMQFLLGNKLFQEHVAAGFITYRKNKVEIEKQVEDMNPKDGSAPLTPKDFEVSENSEEDSKIYKKKVINPEPMQMTPKGKK